MEEFPKYRVALTADSVVFGVVNDELNILLVKRKYDPYKGQHALPGGFMMEGEDLHQCAARELEEETGITGVYLKKINFYGAVDRDPRERIVTTVFMGLIDASKYKPKGGSDAEEAQWVSVDGLKGLAFDHDKILKEALNELRWQVQMTNIAAQLMPKKFTLTQLQKAYESVLGRTLDKRNFRKRISALDILKGLNEEFRDGAHRPAQLFSFKVMGYTPLKDRMNVLFFN